MTNTERLVRAACKLRLDAIQGELHEARERWTAEQQTKIGALPRELRESVRRYLRAGAELDRESKFLHAHGYGTPTQGHPALAKLRRYNGSGPEEVALSQRFSARRTKVAQLQQSFAVRAITSRTPALQQQLLKLLSVTLERV